MHTKTCTYSVLQNIFYVLQMEVFRVCIGMKVSKYRHIFYFCTNDKWNHRCINEKYLQYFLDSWGPPDPEHSLSSTREKQQKGKKKIKRVSELSKITFESIDTWVTTKNVLINLNMTNTHDSLRPHHLFGTDTDSEVKVHV